MVSFELDKEPRTMFSILSRAWDKENILSPHEESNLRTTDSALRCHRDSTVSEVYYEVHLQILRYRHC